MVVMGGGGGGGEGEGENNLGNHVLLGQKLTTTIATS